MIHERLDTMYRFIPESEKNNVRQFLSKLSLEMNEGTYEIDGGLVYAKIMSYETKEADTCTIEAHDKYVDIQFTLEGAEGISIFNREELRMMDLNEDEDFVTFHNIVEPKIKIVNEYGYFTLIHTYEAHRPGEAVLNKASWVKKGVIKIKEELFNE